MGYANEHETVLDKNNFIEYWEDTERRRNNSGSFDGGLIGEEDDKQPIYWMFEDGRKERMTAYFFGYTVGADGQLTDEFVRRITLLSGEVVDV